jgi:hypothetical protein
MSPQTLLSEQGIYFPDAIEPDRRQNPRRVQLIQTIFFHLNPVNHHDK